MKQHKNMARPAKPQEQEKLKVVPDTYQGESYEKFQSIRNYSHKRRVQEN